LSEMVRDTVETLNKLLDEEADQMIGAKRYERSEGRQDTCYRHCTLRKIHPILFLLPETKVRKNIDTTQSPQTDDILKGSIYSFSVI